MFWYRHETKRACMTGTNGRHVIFIIYNIWYTCCNIQIIWYTCCNIQIIWYTRCNIQIIWYTCCNIQIIWYTCCNIQIIWYTCCNIQIIWYTCCNIQIIWYTRCNIQIIWYTCCNIQMPLYTTQINYLNSKAWVYTYYTSHFLVDSLSAKFKCKWQKLYWALSKSYREIGWHLLKVQCLLQAWLVKL